MDVSEWRRQREGLLDRLYHLEAESAGRKRDERVVAENIIRLNQRVAELDAKFEQESGG